MDDEERDYQYQPVHTGEIRLLSIEAGSWSDEPRCVLYNEILWHRTDPLPKYEALSYVWGDDLNPQPLRCGVTNETVYVTQNCFSAIRRLRLESESRVVWIDAVCINQQDLEERSAQVAFMPEIYAWADRVIVYLGEQYENSQLAMDMVNEFASIKDTNLETLPVVSAHWASNASLAQFGNEAAISLLRRPWFNRIWVVQEVVRARSVIVLCGDRSASWKDFRSFWLFSFMRTSSGTPSSEELPMERPSIFELSLHGPQPELDGGLIRFLQALRDRKSTDLRDKVFAVYGLVNGTIPAAYAADYKKQVTEVYHDIAVYALSRFSALAILSAVQERLSVRPYNLPSWVPDWSEMPSRSPLCDPSQFNLPESSDYEAGGKNEHSGIQYEISDLRNGRLVTPGLNLGTISQCSSPYDADVLDDHDVFEEWTQLSRRQWPTEGDAETVEEAEGEAEWQFLLTLSGDLSLINKMVPRGRVWRQYFLWRHFYLGEDVEYLSEFDDGLADMNHDGGENAMDLDGHQSELDSDIDLVANANEGNIGEGTSHEELKGIFGKGNDEGDKERNGSNEQASGKGKQGNDATYCGESLSEAFSEHLKSHISHALRHVNVFRKNSPTIAHRSKDEVDLRKRHKADRRLADDFHRKVVKVCHERQYFVTDNGYMGVCPGEAKLGDSVWILKGGPVPYVLRRSRHQTDTFELVGEAYCQGVMWGEVLRAQERVDRSDQGPKPKGTWVKVVLS